MTNQVNRQLQNRGNTVNNSGPSRSNEQEELLKRQQLELEQK
jgi:hypothetical protein